MFAAYDTWRLSCGATPLPPIAGADLRARCVGLASLPGVSVGVASLEGCAKALSAASCAEVPLSCLQPHHSSELRTNIWAGPLGQSSYDLFPRAPGTLAQGAPCDVSFQCASGLCTSLDGGGWVSEDGSCGVCAVLRKLGEACDAANPCERGECTSGVCAETGDPAGAMCTKGPKGESGCQASLACDAPDLFSGGGPGKCVPRLAVGAACVDQGIPCTSGALCSEGTCVAETIAALGQTCGGGTISCEENSLCGPDNHCVLPDAAVPLKGDCYWATCAPGLVCGESWVCAKPHSVGQQCINPTSCAADLVCAGSTWDPATGINSFDHCMKPLAEGDECKPGTCVDGLYCDGSPTGHCVKEAGLGAPCGANHPCPASSMCRDGVCRPIGACSGS